MRRDWELIRKIVLATEDHPHGSAPKQFQFDDYTEEQIGYHCYLVVDMGYAEGRNTSDTGSKSPRWKLTHLTSAGHDFAEASRNNTIWDSTMKLIKDKTGTVTNEILKLLLTAGLRSAFGI